MPLTEVARFTVPYLSVLDADGNVDEALEPALPPGEWGRLYRAMTRAREADDRMLRLQRQGRLGTFGPCTGQEAAHCAPTLALAEGDWLVTSFRELGARLMRGDTLLGTLLYYNGYEEGNAAPEGTRDLPVNIIVATQLPHAVGIGYALRFRGEEAAVLAFVGDGGTSQGEFHEALNFAGVWQAPVVFVIQNNGWAISLPRARQTRAQTLAQMAIAAGIPGIQVDGNDALAMYRAASEALAKARGGGGPTVIEAVTYRLMMHTTSDDPGRYRSEEETQEWWKRDPLPRLRAYLERKGWWDAGRQEALVAEVRAELEAAVQELEERTEFRPDTQFDHVFGTRHPSLERQRAEFLAGQEGR